MVWHSPTYSNDDILSTTIHQEPTIPLLSEAWGKMIHEKTRIKKSHDTVPLIVPSMVVGFVHLKCYKTTLWQHYFLFVLLKKLHAHEFSERTLSVSLYTVC
jgi:hypothetical protein